MPEDKLEASKYVVYHHPPFPDDPTKDDWIKAYYFEGVDPEDQGEIWLDMQEVSSFVFVLRPDRDVHARVALAAYIESAKQDYPRLSEELRHVLEVMEAVNDPC